MERRDLIIVRGTRQVSGLKFSKEIIFIEKKVFCNTCRCNIGMDTRYIREARFLIEASLFDGARIVKEARFLVEASLFDEARFVKKPSFLIEASLFDEAKFVKEARFFEGALM